MCGICGKVYFSKQRRVERNIIEKMNESIFHRGPDEGSIHIDENFGFGHRRLSIIDLNTGKQPISNEDEKIWIIFNGEIYNFQDLRNDLRKKGHIFKTKSDTEVILHLYEEMGVQCLSKLRGMFAFAIFDKRNNSLFIARDRVGIKPLYYSITPESLVFASELKALLFEPKLDKSVNNSAIIKFLSYTYTPGPDTVFKKIHKLQPGHYITLTGDNLVIKQYWDIDKSYAQNNENEKNLKERLENLLKDTIKLHMISDVPVGFLLSGGIDSTTTLSLYADNQTADIKTFTIGFESNEFNDERVFARKAAQQYGVDHYETTFNDKEFFDFLPKYIWHMEEPIFEPPAVSLYYVSKMARDHVKVLISGEGGDEAFAGYQTYRNLVWLERIKSILGPLNSQSIKLFSFLTFPKFKKYISLMKFDFPDYYFSRSTNPNHPFIKIQNEIFSSNIKNDIEVKLKAQPFYNYAQKLALQSKLKQMLYIDTKTWLPDRLLTKADKITMANSLELRVPFLDHKVLEFAAKLPDNQKLKGIKTKYILKQIAAKRISKEIINRKKEGFPTPYNLWLKQQKDTVLDILYDPKTVNRGYFNYNSLEKFIIRPWLKNNDNSEEMFNLLTLELWHRKFIDSD
jgi:asparagine synthase (glutamine-hydrolysing)